MDLWNTGILQQTLHSVTTWKTSPCKFTVACNKTWSL